MKLFGLDFANRFAGSIRARLTAAFILVVVLMLAGETLTVVEFLNLHGQSEVIAAADRKQLAILHLHADLLTFSGELGPLIEANDAVRLTPAAELLESRLRSDLYAARSALGGSSAGSVDSRLEITLDTVESSFPTQIGALVSLAFAGDWNALLLRYKRQSNALLTLTSAAVSEVDEAVSRERIEAEKNIRFTRRRLLITIPVALVLSVLAAGVMGFTVTRSIVRPLRDLDSAARALQRSDLDHRVTPAAIDELASVALAFNDAAAELKRVNVRLTRELAERARAETEVAALNQQLVTAQEEERSRIARELHDDFGQQIAAVNIGLSKLRQQLPDQFRRMRDTAAGLQRRLEKLAEAVRSLSHELHPAQLEYMGLGSALQSHCEEFSAHHGIRVQFNTVNGPFEDLPPAAALCLYRLAQEALQNVAKHSRASSAEVHLARENDSLSLRISDNGVGFSPDRSRGSAGGLGISNMKERVRVLKGQFQIRSQPLQGTTIEVSVPVQVCSTTARNSIE